MAQEEGRSVLLVSSDPRTEQVLTEVCRTLNMQFTIARNLCEALVTLQCVFDLVLLGGDIAMEDQKKITSYVSQRWSLITTLVGLQNHQVLPRGIDVDQYVAGAVSLQAPLPEITERVRAIIETKKFMRICTFARGIRAPLTEVFVENFGVVTGMLRGINRSGMFIGIPMNDLPQVGSTCSIRIDNSPGNWNIIKGSGVVRWRSRTLGDPGGNGIGIQFVTITDSALSSLLAHIES